MIHGPCGSHRPLLHAVFHSFYVSLSSWSFYVHWCSQCQKVFLCFRIGLILDYQCCCQRYISSGFFSLVKMGEKTSKACTESRVCQQKPKLHCQTVFLFEFSLINLSLSLWCTQHSIFVFSISSLLSNFMCLKPSMLSVVNGLASCFKAEIAECKFWLLRFIYTGILKLIVYISSHHGMTQCKQK